MLDVTDPQPGAVVTAAVYTFRGVTDPGCTVDVGGKYFADVDADGAWTLDLLLRPGGNATTFTATDGAGSTTTAQVSLVYAPIVLSAEGLGVVDFGDPPEEVVAALSELLGPPTLDDLPYPGESIFPGSYFRIVSWDEPRLHLEFIDYAPYALDHLPFFSYWGTEIGEPNLSTAEGVGPGSAYADLIEAYGERLRVFPPNECDALWTFAIDLSEGSGPFFVRGALDGDPSNLATRVLSIDAGIEMGPC
jgi:hypothetical protein